MTDAGRATPWRWRKLGRVFEPSAYPAFAGSHAQVPAPLLLDDRIRVYYADRDASGRSFPTFIDVDRTDPTRVIGVNPPPLLPPAAPGAFDDEGLMPACALHRDGLVWLYYSGWNRRHSVPYHNATGLVVSDDGGRHFRRLFDGPVMDRTAREPYLAVTPWVAADSAGSALRAWYVSGTRWERVGERYEPVYVICSAHSINGVDWTRNGVPCFVQTHPLEAQAHPSVLRTEGAWHMWFCYRDSHDFRDGGGAYRIGYARSRDGVRFERDDARAGIDVSAEGWDSKMICYPSVIAVGIKVYMFYNGNGFGRSGIGVAELDGTLEI